MKYSLMQTMTQTWTGWCKHLGRPCRCLSCLRNRLRVASCCFPFVYLHFVRTPAPRAGNALLPLLTTHRLAFVTLLPFLVLSWHPPAAPLASSSCFPDIIPELIRHSFLTWTAKTNTAFCDWIPWLQAFKALMLRARTIRGFFLWKGESWGRDKLNISLTDCNKRQCTQHCWRQFSVCIN